jgi:hypothetical protein
MTMTMGNTFLELELRLPHVSLLYHLEQFIVPTQSIEYDNKA